MRATAPRGSLNGPGRALVDHSPRPALHPNLHRCTAHYTTTAMSSSRCKLVLTVVCGSTLGAVLGELTANCLIEIYGSLVFSLVFAICFMMISGTMIWRVLKTTATRAKRAVVGTLTASVFLSAAACVAIRFVTDATSQQLLHLALFAQIAVSLSLVFTFTLLEFITLGIFEKIGCACCPHGYLPSSKQLLVLLFGAVFAGIMFGLLFGLLQVQQLLVDTSLTVLQLYMVIALPAGFVLGGALAALYRVVGGDTVSVTLDREKEPLLPEQRILWDV